MRGHRIEIDDIELACTAHPGVEEAGAWPVWQDGELIDIAASVLLQLDSGTEITESGLREFLAGRLPNYALPGRIAIVPSLPRTTSGKIDRRRLQELDEQSRMPNTGNR